MLKTTMKKTDCYKIFIFVGLVFGSVSCVDPYQLQTSNYEEAIVIEASITNEVTKHEVKVSKTYRLEDDNGNASITDAEVFVTDSDGVQYNFEFDTNSYKSTSEFAALPEKQYTLTINTSNGKTYKSTPKKLTTVNQIESVVPIVKTNLDGERGVSITVNSFDPTNTSKYYRYEYEETSKVTAPKWRPAYAVVNPDNSGVVGHPYIELFNRTEEARTCYTPNKSNSIILTNTSTLIEDRVSEFEIRFLHQSDYTIAERYSVLVKQYVESLESYTYYRILHELSQSGEVLSPTQPGFIAGNLFSVDNPNEKVVGYFNVSSVSEKRIFFNYTDLFPGEALPPYFDTCDEIEFNYCFDPAPAECDGTRLNGLVLNNAVIYYEISGLNYNFIKPVCGDCTSFSSNIRPEFWID
jgi:hypothetical protein